MLKNAEGHRISAIDVGSGNPTEEEGFRDNPGGLAGAFPPEIDVSVRDLLIKISFGVIPPAELPSNPADFS